jgi:hypothetical protein
LKYLGCSGTCEVQVWPATQPRFFSEASDVADGGASVTVDGVTCASYSKGSNNKVWYSSTKKICKAVWSGVTYDFSSVQTSNLNNTVFSDYKYWNCPQQQCFRAADIVLGKKRVSSSGNGANFISFAVLDNSGSISNSNWKIATQFGISLTNSYSVSNTLINMGVVSFQSEATAETNLTGTADNVINAIKGIKHKEDQGSTCIGCGVGKAMEILDASSRRNSVNQIIIVLTDGENNRKLSRNKSPPLTVS